ncbi:hypothetical protein, partial [Sulfitobacter sp. 15WGC]|uniref:hypothetical protein n=1 Tax=Sulfitobacter sp. 15WGC TaxID=2575437 RepID=UPI001B7FC875
EFELNDDDREYLPEGMKGASYVLWRNLDNSTGHRLTNAPAKKNLQRSRERFGPTRSTCGQAIHLTRRWFCEISDRDA